MVIWEFQKYRAYLMSRLGGDGARTGLRKKLAEHIPVHTTFVTQVMKGRAELSLEQAESVNDFFEHSEAEGEYFLLLVMHERAGTKTLKKRFAQKIEVMRNERLNVQSRIGAKEAISEKDREKFYSSYIYGAVHVLTSLPQFQQVESLAAGLRLSKARVQEIVDFCIRIGVLKLEKGQLTPGSTHIHLGNQSELVLKHHQNWRQQAIQSLQFLDKEDLHYSACVSLTESDAFRVKEGLLAHLKDQVQLISNSREEVAYVLNLDFHKLLGS